MPTARQSVPEDTWTVTASPTEGRSVPRDWAIKAAIHVPTLEAWHLAIALRLWSRVTPFFHLFNVTSMRAEGDSSSLSAYSWALLRLTDMVSKEGAINQT